MGRKIDFDQPLSDEDKEYLRSRGAAQASKIEANERRFGVDGKGGVAAEFPELESAGQPTDSAWIDTDERDQAVYDLGGVPLPGNVLSKDTGQVIPLSARTDEGLDYIDPETGKPAIDPDHFDEDIVESVEGLKINDLRSALKDEKVAYDPGDDKEKLQDLLIIARQDKRNAQASAPRDIGIDESAQFLDPARGEKFDLPEDAEEQKQADDKSAAKAE